MELFGNLSQLASICKSIGVTCLEVKKLVSDIAGDVDIMRHELEQARAAIDSELVYEFSSAAREVNYRAAETKLMFSNLHQRWDQLSSEISRAASLTTVESWKLRRYKEQIQDHLTYASQCKQSDLIFKESLDYVMRIAFGLSDRTRECANKAKSGAKNTRIVGYSAAGAMGAGAVACSIVAFFTGGLSLIGTAVLGAGAIAAAAATKKHSAQLDKLAEDFQNRLSSIEGSIREMESLAESVDAARLQGVSAVSGLEQQMYYLTTETKDRRTREEQLQKQIRQLTMQLENLRK